MARDVVGYIALGGNLGDRIGALRQAVERLDAHVGIVVRRTSYVYESRAHVAREADVQPHYLNAVVELCTAFSAEYVLALCQKLEAAAGRRRRDMWMARTLDLDLLVLGDEVRRGPDLFLPHPRLGKRRFVLRPWADLSPNLRVPHPFDVTVATLLDRCPDADEPTRMPLRLQFPVSTP